MLSALYPSTLNLNIPKTMAQKIYEEFRATGQEVLGRVRELIHEGNARRLIIKNRDDKTLLEVPLTVGAASMGGAFFMAPVLSAIGAFAFFSQDARILVERYPEEQGPLENRLRRTDQTQKERTYGRSTAGARPAGKGRGRRKDPFEIEIEDI